MGGPTIPFIQSSNQKKMAQPKWQISSGEIPPPVFHVEGAGDPSAACSAERTRFWSSSFSWRGVVPGCPGSFPRTRMKGRTKAKGCFQKKERNNRNQLQSPFSNFRMLLGPEGWSTNRPCTLPSTEAHRKLFGRLH